MEKRAKYAKIHPEMSNLDLTKILSKKYKELPDKKKVSSRVWASQLWVFCSLLINTFVLVQQKYITEFQREKEEFEKNMARFK